MIAINWPLVWTNTVLLYVLIVITLPFNQVYSTLFLFALIAFWTRLPGMGVHQGSFPVLWVTDMVDFFSMLVAINLGGIIGGIFSLYANLMGRLCGIYPSWRFTLEDAGSIFLACLIIPFFRPLYAGDIFIAMILFTAIKGIILMPISFMLVPYSKVQWLIEWIVGASALFIVNGFYAKLFGGFFNSILTKGVSFSWILFIIVNIVILVFYISVFRKTKKPHDPFLRNLVRYIIKNLKKRKSVMTLSL